MKESNILADNATIKQLRSKILLYTNGEFMKESNTHAGNAIIKQQQSIVLLNTKGRFMKELNIHAGNVIIKQQRRRILFDTNGLFMKESNSLVSSAESQNLVNIKDQFMKKQNTLAHNHQSPSNVDLIRHQKNIHEKFQYPPISKKDSVGNKRTANERVMKKQRRFKPLLRSGALSQISTIEPTSYC